VELVELTPRVHLIRPAFGQAYVVRDGSRLTLVDTGVPGSEADLAAAFAELGYRRGDLRRIVLTHGHEDHVGAAAALRDWGDVEVLAHGADAPVVRGERRRAEPTVTAAERPLYDQVTAAILQPPPCPVDTELTDGDTLDVGGGALVVGTPGHTDGSIALWLPEMGVLLPGDTVATGPDGPILGPFNVDRGAALASAAALAALPAAVVGVGHGDPVLDAGAWRAFAALCAEGAVPDPLG
jgi:glyoxylase-like metal-dependent hydrolase (beta-lactamase superfamily II)